MSHPATRIRPYTMTGGRTAPALEFSADSEVQRLTVGSLPVGLGPAQRRVLELLDQPTTVAEVAARADVPLPVVQVLIGDLAELCLVAVGNTPYDRDRADIEFLRKVLEGLHAP